MVSKLVFSIVTYLAIISENIIATPSEDGPLFRNDYTYMSVSNAHLKSHTSQKWVNAVAICKAEGAKLFIPKTFDEINAVENFHNKKSPLWVGVHDMFSEGQFLSIDGDRLTGLDRKWASGQPDDKGHVKNCVVLNDTELYDEDCDKSYDYVCMKKAVKNLSRNTACDTYDNEYIYDVQADRCYKIHTDPMNWKDAFRTCQAEQASLAIINCEDEAEILKKILSKYPAEYLEGTFHKDLIHLGFNDLFYDKQYMTTNGETLKDAGYNRWGHNQPDNYEHSEHCGSMYRDGKLYDINCDDVFSMFVCEKTLGNPNNVHTFSRFGI